MAKARKVVDNKKPAASTSTESKASSPFLKALKAKKTAFKKFKGAKKGGGFERSNIPDGTYKTRWTAKAGISKNNDPYVMLNWVVTEGKHKGEKDGRYFNLGEDKNWEYLSSTLQQLLDEDTSGLGDNPEEIKDWLDQVNDLKPVTKTNISRNGDYLNAYIQELIDSGEDEEEEDEDSEEDEEEYDESEDDDAEEEDDEEDEEDSEDSDDEDGEYEEEEDEEDEVILSKGDEVSYKPPKSKKTYNCTVTSANKSKRTCALESEDGEKTWTNVSWDDVEVA